jgi:hypothetical protein
MTVAWMVLAVGGLVFIGAYIWLLVTAFKEGTAWGVAGIIILPFAVKFWDRAKMPFLGCLTGLVLIVIGAVGYSMTSVNVGIEEYGDIGEQVAWESPVIESLPPSAETWDDGEEGLEVPDGAPASNGEIEDSEGVNEGVPGPTSGESAAVSILQDVANEPPPPRRPHRDGPLVPISKLGLLQGERVVLVLTSLERVSAYVISVDDQSVLLRQRVGGGSVTYKIDYASIKEIRSRRAP